MAGALPGGGRSRTFFFARVTVLSLLLLGVLLYAACDVRRRRARTEWDRSLEVGLVLVRKGRVTGAATDALRARVPELEAALSAEMRRYRPGAMPPFRFVVYGPVDAPGEPPRTPEGDGLGELARYAYEQWRFLGELDRRAGVPARSLDSRIYLYATPGGGERDMVEGASEQGGRVGTVSVELGDGMADFALFVAAHELFHTLGASDKYEPGGAVRVPEGLADPAQRPLYPQAQAELMARHRAVAPGKTAPPASLDELAVGPATAREIGWAR